MLSAEQFAELVALIQVAQEHEPKASVRRAERFENPCRTTIALMTENGAAEQSHEVQVRDISARGVSFHHDHFLKQGAAFILRLHGEGSQTASIFCVVIHTREVAANVFQVGAEFSKLLDKKTVPLVSGGSAEDLMISRSRLR